MTREYGVNRVNRATLRAFSKVKDKETIANCSNRESPLRL